MSRVGFLLLLGGLGEAAWGLAAVQNDRHNARYPRRPIVNEIRGLVGARGVVTRVCSPRGQVRVDGEIWQAEASQLTPIREGVAVNVKGYRGLVLLVQPVESGPLEGAA